MKLSFDRIAAIVTTVRALNGGAKFKDIAPKVNRSVSTVRRWVNRAGFYRNREGKWRLHA